MRRFLITAALAAALLAPVALAPTPAAAQSCSSSTISGTTFTNCYGPDGSMSTGTSQRVGSSSFESVSGVDGNGNAFGGTGSTIRTGDSSFSTWSTWP
jgi:hypothetical protein